MILLIHPPVAKPSEPPAGIARLSGMLGSLGVEHQLLDANAEGLIHLLRNPLPPENARDTWTRRAFRNLEPNLHAMRDPVLYCHPDRYKKAVRDIARVLASVSPHGKRVSLANYEDQELSPLKSGDLITAAGRPEQDPFYPYFHSRLEGLFLSKKPAMVGISLNYLSQALVSFSLIGLIKRQFPGVKVILGGGLVTSWVKNPAWKNPFSGLVDHLVAGPGEYPLLTLLGLHATETKIPRPDYSTLSQEAYLSPGFILPYSASTGCYWNRCAFCPEKAEGNPYLSVPAQQVIEDLGALGKAAEPCLIHILDNAISPTLLNSLSESPTGTPWYGFARVSPRLADPDFCIELKRSGCVMLKLGIESGDQHVLNALQKGISLETASAVLKNLRRAGIGTYVYLIFGTPAESERSAEKTLEFTVQHSDCIDFLNLAIFNMPVCQSHPPDVEIRRFSEGDLSLYTDFVHPQGWDRRHVRLFLEKKFRRHPAVAGILNNEPPVFTSNHAPFFVKSFLHDHPAGVS